MIELDIIDWAIIVVGLTLLPLIPDLFGNILVVFLPEAYVTTSVRKWSSAVRRCSNTAVSGFLVAASIAIPPVALCFQPSMLAYRGDDPHSRAWAVEVAMCGALMIFTEVFYFATLLTEPGFVYPREDAHVSDGAGAGWSSCKKCGAGRPPRAHHCSICRRCVLRMDHHCPFTNCCVGLLNERYFIVWLACVWTGTLYGCSVSLRPFITCVLRSAESITLFDLARCTEAGHTSFVFLPACGLFLFISVLLSWHIMLMATNQTTIEFFRYRLGAPTDAQTGGLPSPNYSNGSLLGNVCEVFSPPMPASLLVVQGGRVRQRGGKNANRGTQ